MFLSMPRRKFPSELERMIFLLVLRSTALTCMLVATRVKLWLDPSIYRAVCLSGDRRAQRFLESIKHRPDFARTTVEALCLNVNIRLETATPILRLCAGLKNLNMRIPCNLIGSNPILTPLNNLTRLDVLYVDLSSIFNNKGIYLPDVSIFRRVTHLHLSNAWASWRPAGNSIGLEQLKQITHLSLFLSTVRTLPSLLTKILSGQSLVVLVLWKRSFVQYRAADQFLRDCELVDKRIVILDEHLFQSHMLDDTFWASAERVINQREGTDAMPGNGVIRLMEVCIASPATNSNCVSDWEVETQVYSSPQGDDSGEETDEASSGEESAEEGSSGEQNEDL